MLYSTFVHGHLFLSEVFRFGSTQFHNVQELKASCASAMLFVEGIRTKSNENSQQEGFERVAFAGDRAVVRVEAARPKIQEV